MLIWFYQHCVVMACKLVKSLESIFHSPTIREHKTGFGNQMLVMSQRAMWTIFRLLMTSVASNLKQSFLWFLSLCKHFKCPKKASVLFAKSPQIFEDFNDGAKSAVSNSKLKKEN